MTEVQLPARSINRALRASHDRLVSDVLVPDDPDYPFPEEDYLEFAIIQWENSWDRECERASWTVPDPDPEDDSVEISIEQQGSAQAGLSDFA